MVRYY